MKFLMTCAPAVGHVVPLLGLGQALRDAGHAVRVATHPDVHALVTDAGLSPVAVGMSARAMRQERLRRWPDTADLPATAWAVQMFSQVLGPATLVDLVELFEEWQPDLVVHEEGEYAGPVAAARAGVPWVTHGWGSPLRPVAELDSLNEHTAGLWQSVGLDPAVWGGLYRHVLVNPCPAALQPVAPGAGLVWPVRPEPLGESAARSSTRAARPDAYVGFGTVPLFAEDEVCLAAAVGACTARGLHTVVTTPDERLALRLEAAAPRLVRAATFVALPDVLPSCQVVVCHGGAGTVLAALQAGVPLVIVSKSTPSQNRMADACAAAGVAAVAGPTPAGIDAAIAQVLDEPSFGQRARSVAESIHAMPRPSDLIGPLIELGSLTGGMDCR